MGLHSRPTISSSLLTLLQSSSGDPQFVNGSSCTGSSTCATPSSAPSSTTACRRKRRRSCEASNGQPRPTVTAHHPSVACHRPTFTLVRWGAPQRERPSRGEGARARPTGSRWKVAVGRQVQWDLHLRFKARLPSPSTRRCHLCHRFSRRCLRCRRCPTRVKACLVTSYLTYINLLQSDQKARISPTTFSPRQARSSIFRSSDLRPARAVE